MTATIVEAPGNPLGFEFKAEVDRRMEHYRIQVAAKDPNWCTGKCLAPGCNADCAYSKGHKTPHRCWTHMI